MIYDHEIQTGWSHWAGLPKPREAVLIGQGVGPARMATFDKGLKFLATVTDWQENKLMSFVIDTQDNHYLDPHVNVGGQFFDVQSGTYRLEEVSPGVTLLHLSSTQRVSTHFNAYTRFQIRF